MPHSPALLLADVCVSPAHIHPTLKAICTHCLGQGMRLHHPLH